MYFGGVFDIQASAMLAIARCLSVRLSVTSRCCIATAERIELIFEHRFYSFGLLYTELQEKSETAKIRVLPSETLSQTRNLEKFRYGASTVVIQPTTVAILSHWASILVHNAMGVAQCSAASRRVGLLVPVEI